MGCPPLLAALPLYPFETTQHTLDIPLENITAKVQPDRLVLRWTEPDFD